ncbi:sorting nexin-10-like [Mizuhopecten yessoensis]|uniref:Sorting nexin-10A n=1 Tax=Mizuhopecten yessoensis TaxID=6573 RepID=A0A210Q2S3_MIZYE|nr:sorting nexin-10-like [Mizuhopecten yessoensis]OWF43034.1 Sorting nexin-10A [Mizuhopecten yessoensis]
MSSVDVCVRNPVTHNTWDNGRYITYEIAIKTSNCAFSLSESLTRRRYSEFEWLRKRLRLHHPLLKPPPLPPKKIFGDRFDADFIAFRMKDLENFLIKLLEVKLFVSDALLHLFIQSDLTCKDIDDVMDGKMGADVIEHIWQSGGIKENCRDFNKNAVITTKSDVSPLDEPNEDASSVISDSSVDYLTESTSSSVTEEEFSAFPPLSEVIDNSGSELSPTGHVTPTATNGGTAASQINRKDAKNNIETGIFVDKFKYLKQNGENRREEDLESDSDIEVLSNVVASTRENELTCTQTSQCMTETVSPTQHSGPQQTHVTCRMSYSINGDIC